MHTDGKDDTHCQTRTAAAIRHPNVEEGSRPRPAVGSLTTAKSDAEIKPRFCPAKYPEKFAGKYLQKYPQSCARLRGHVYLHLNSDLYLDLSDKLFAELSREKFEKLFLKSFQKMFAMLFDLLFDLKYRLLYVSSYLVLYRQKPRGRRPVGRGVGGRIVVENGPTTTYRQSYGTVEACARPARRTGRLYNFVY